MKSPEPHAARRSAAKPHAAKAKPVSTPTVESAEAPGEGLNARRAALALVKGALDHRGGLEEAFARKPFSELELRDRALARMMAMTLLRRLGAIDRLLDGKLHKPPPEDVRMLLRLGVAQVLYMDIPAFAAVDTTVRLAQGADDTRPFKGLINAVLRGLLRDGPVIEDPESLAPGWLFARWRATYGELAAQAMVSAIALEPLTDLSLKRGEDLDPLVEALEGEALPGGSLRTPLRGDVADWPGYAEGQWWVQDAAAALPTRLLALKPGETTLDMCAAPGGKTLQMAAAGAVVTALDRSAQRLTRLTQSLERTGLTAEILASEADRWEDPRVFDAVLLDAPLLRHRDIPTPSGRSVGHEAGRYRQAGGGPGPRCWTPPPSGVRPGGRLVYCVCSLEPEEGEGQAEGFLARHSDFSLVPVMPGEGGAPEGSVTPAGFLRVLPHHAPGGMDGFFAARFVRKKLEASARLPL